MAPAAALWLCVAAQAAAPAPASGTHFHGALEATAQLFPSEHAGSEDVYAVLTPLLGFDGGDDFGFELGAELRFLVATASSTEREMDYGHVLRRQDWDELSDFGQILRDLRLGAPADPLQLRAGPLEDFTLGWGHLLNRYGNRLNPDYHPSGATLVGSGGPAQGELVVSDILAARLFAGQASVDVGRLFSSAPAWAGRFHAAGSLAYDVGRAGGDAPALGLGQVDLDAALYRGAGAQLFLEAGTGIRLDVPTTGLSGEVGLAADVEQTMARWSAKLELRKQSAELRPGMVGPAYELSRFSDTGLAGTPLSDVRLPEGSFSGYGEVATQVAVPNATVTGSLAVEHFSWGRTDGDLAAALHLLDGRVVASGRLIAVGLGEAPRWSAQADVRARLAPSFYVLAYGGTVHVLQASGTLSAGAQAGIGAAVDFDR